jgi:hypothetical protein
MLTYADASTGYCQSLNYLGGLIVIVVEPEEDCFWLLCALLHKVQKKKERIFFLRGNREKACPCAS